MKPSYLAESLGDSGDVKTSYLVTLRRRIWCRCRLDWYCKSWGFGIKINCSYILCFQFFLNRALFVGCTSEQLMSGSGNGRLSIECPSVTVHLVSS